MLKLDCETNNYFYKLYKKFCPGPITFVLELKKNSKISKIVTNNNKTLAIRFPKHKISTTNINKATAEDFKTINGIVITDNKLIMKLKHNNTID